MNNKLNPPLCVHLTALGTVWVNSTHISHHCLHDTPHLGIWLGWIICVLCGGCGIYKKMVLQLCGTLPITVRLVFSWVVGLLGYRETDFGLVPKVLSPHVWDIHLKKCLFALGKERHKSFKKTKTVFISTSFICCGFWKHVSTAKCPNYRADSVWPIRFSLDSGIWSHKTDCQSFISAQMWINARNHFLTPFPSDCPTLKITILKQVLGSTKCSAYVPG